MASCSTTAINLHAQSVVLFSNIPNGTILSSDVPNGWVVGSGDGGNSHYRIALGFAVTSATYLSSVDVLVDHNTGVDGARVSLYSDVSNHPGSELDFVIFGETITSGTGFPAYIGYYDPLPVTNIVFNHHPLMSAGNNYWLVLSGVQTTTFESWRFIPGGGSNFATDGTMTDPGNWQTVLSVYIDGYGTITNGPPIGRITGVLAAVPEPGSSALLSAAGVLILGVARTVRHRKES